LLLIGVDCVCEAGEVDDAFAPVWTDRFLLFFPSSRDGYEVLFESVLYEVAVAKYLPKVFFGVVVELGISMRTIMRNSLKNTPSFCCAFLEKNLKSRLIFSRSVDLMILAGWGRGY
jgi:hypothetical protein